MPSCFAKDCKNSTLNNSSLRFFGFPSDPQKRQVWLALCGKSDIINNKSDEYSSILICSDHFLKDQYTDQRKCNLRVTAVPTVFSFALTLQTKEEVAADKEWTIYDVDTPNETENEPYEISFADEPLYDPDASSEEEKEPKVPNNPTPSPPICKIESTVSTAGLTRIPGGEVISAEVTPTGRIRKLIKVPKHVYEDMQKKGQILTSSDKTQPTKYPAILPKTTEKRLLPQTLQNQGGKKFIIIQPGSISKPMPTLAPLSQTVSSSSVPLANSNTPVNFLAKMGSISKPLSTLAPLSQTVSTSSVPRANSNAPTNSLAKMFTPGAICTPETTTKPQLVSPKYLPLTAADANDALKKFVPKALKPSENKRKQDYAAVRADFSEVEETQPQLKPTVPAIRESSLKLTEPLFSTIRVEPPAVTLSKIAPNLPIQPKKVDFKNYNFMSLKPSGWQDWPVALEIFIPAANQLQENYTKLFPRRDRMDIETTLHLAAHYKFLNDDSKSHVRARVHHFLKILQIEQEKRAQEDAKEKEKQAAEKNSKDTENIENEENPKASENVKDQENPKASVSTENIEDQEKTKQENNVVVQSDSFDFL